jgi:hypothetical protein
MDKLKAQANELAEKAQAGVTQGQAKVTELQAKRRADALLRDLGAATYAEHLGGDSSTERARLLRDLDRHAAEHGPISTAPTADSASAWSAATRGGGAGGGRAPDEPASGGYAGEAGATPGADWPDSGTADVPPPAAVQSQSGTAAPGGLPGGELRDAGAPLDEPLDQPLSGGPVGSGPAGGGSAGGEPPTSSDEPNSDAHAVTGVAESMPGPAGDNLR